MGKLTFADVVPKEDRMLATGPEEFPPGEGVEQPLASTVAVDRQPPAAPQRTNFSTEEEFEEALSRWRWTVGRNQAFRDLRNHRPT